jgi:hypothetical protein
MKATNKRKNTRSQTWPDTKATIKVADAYGGSTRNHITVTGVVQNLGASGFFLETDEIVPILAKTDIIIDFDAASEGSVLTVRASGQTVHLSRGGVGVRFTSIDLNKLQKCIIAKMNKLDEEAKYKLKDV